MIEDDEGDGMMAEDTESKARPIDWDAPIPLHEAAVIAGVAYPTLKAWLRAGYLETQPWGAKGKVTTRGFLLNPSKTVVSGVGLLG